MRHPSLRTDLVRAAVEPLDDERPRRGGRVAVDVEDRRDDVRLDLVHVHGERVAAAVDAQPVRDRRLERRAVRPRLRAEEQRGAAVASLSFVAR